MATLFEIGAHVAIVVNLAVEHYGHGVIFVEGGLVAREEIDDREPSDAQRDPVIHQIAFGIGPAMMHPIAHRAQQFLRALRRCGAWIEIGPTGYAAHKIKLTTEDTEEEKLISLDNKALDAIFQMKTVKVN